MNVLKKILLHGFIETMVDESINKHARRIVLGLITACFMCGIIVLTTLAITNTSSTGRAIFWCTDAAVILYVIFIYIKLARFIKKKKQDELKDEAIRQRIRERKEQEYEAEYEHNHRFYT